MKISFVKMHGCGNDYVYIDVINEPSIAVHMAKETWPGVVRRMSNRHTGIGSDGVIAICPPTAQRKRQWAHVRMRMFNADGSESEMCGNGVRCVAKFAHDRLGVRSDEIKVQTGAGVVSIEYSRRSGVLHTATVNMGKPGLRPAQSGVRISRLSFAGVKHAYGLELGSNERIVCTGTFVSMGNPHMVLFDDENPELFGGRAGLQNLDLARMGPLVENHPAFRNRINAHFVSRQSRSEVTMRTWERGSGATQACGTGACAVLVAGVTTGRLARRALLHLPGGDLSINWERASGTVFMTGRAEDVFEGMWDLGSRS